MTVRLPDGSTERCYSPSTVIEARFTVGARYPVAEFAARIRAVLAEAGERVRDRRGFYCTGAAAESARLHDRLAGFLADPTASVAVLGLSRSPPGADAGRGGRDQ